MKTIPSWAYPTLVLGGWLVIAALTLSELATVAPSLRSTAGAERWRPRTACVADASTAPLSNHAAHRPEGPARGHSAAR